MLILAHGKHNVSQLGLHIVWCTKYRHKVLKDGNSQFSEIERQ